MKFETGQKVYQKHFPSKRYIVKGECECSDPDCDFIALQGINCTDHWLLSSQLKLIEIRKPEEWL